jgi:choline transport protein
MGATNNFICANFILGQANLSFPAYVIQRWHTVLLGYLIALGCTAMNIYGPHLLDRLSRGILVWNIASFVVVVVVLLATNDHKQPASFVFRDFQNFTGFGTAYTAILGLLQASFGWYVPYTPRRRPLDPTRPPHGGVYACVLTRATTATASTRPPT